MTRAFGTRLILFAAAAGALALTLGLMAGSNLTSASAGGCPHANAEPDQGSNGDFRQALICLINKERTSRDKNALDPNAKLRKVAGAHTDVMLEQDCFEHRCNGEASLTKRLKNAGYLRGEDWGYAENIGYDNTPRSLVNRWMDRNQQRHHILNGDWIDLGVGVGHGTPDPDKPDNRFVTYTTIFGDGG